MAKLLICSALLIMFLKPHGLVFFKLLLSLVHLLSQLLDLISQILLLFVGVNVLATLVRGEWNLLVNIDIGQCRLLGSTVSERLNAFAALALRIVVTLTLDVGVLFVLALDLFS